MLFQLIFNNDNYNLTKISYQKYIGIETTYLSYYIFPVIKKERNINEFNIPAGNSHGYEILYFGLNLILMLDYRLSFDVEVKNSNKDIIQVLIISRKDIPAWKEEEDNRNSEIRLYYSNQGTKINDVFRPTMHMHLC
jgi:hypothetical protein